MTQRLTNLNDFTTSEVQFVFAVQHVQLHQLKGHVHCTLRFLPLQPLRQHSKQELHVKKSLLRSLGAALRVFPLRNGCDFFLKRDAVRRRYFNCSGQLAHCHVVYKNIEQHNTTLTHYITSCALHVVAQVRSP